MLEDRKSLLTLTWQYREVGQEKLVSVLHILQVISDKPVFSIEGIKLLGAYLHYVALEPTS